jgi:hypothetical protein
LKVVQVVNQVLLFSQTRQQNLLGQRPSIVDEFRDLHV